MAVIMRRMRKVTADWARLPSPPSQVSLRRCMTCPARTWGNEKIKIIFGCTVKRGGGRHEVLNQEMIDEYNLTT